VNKLGHSVGAIVVLGTTIAATQYYKIDLGLTDTIGLYTGITVGSFLPDLDADYSYFRSKLPIIPTVYTWVQKAVKGIPVLDDIFKHRGALLHSVWTLVILGILMYLTKVYVDPYLTNPYIDISCDGWFIGLILGCVGHHFLDMMTVAGLRYFYPSKLNLCFRNRKNRRS
jgi:membrane-bound metal-dependent hydrolase YbcI (DUF457 family)